MCRLVGYLGNSIRLEQLLYQQQHSLYHQSYHPQQLRSGVVCADGVGLGWYDEAAQPFVYRNTTPIWNDPNLKELSRYIQSTCAVGYVRLTGTGESLNISNCQPFRSGKLLFVHNGEITNFHETLLRPLRSSLSDTTYRLIQGMTDSEHIFALLMEIWQSSPDSCLSSVLRATMQKLTELAKAYDTSFSANVIVTNGQELAAIRYAYSMPAPSLYWSCQQFYQPNQVIVASEPLSDENWVAFPEQSTLFTHAGFVVSPDGSSLTAK